MYKCIYTRVQNVVISIIIYSVGSLHVYAVTIVVYQLCTIWYSCQGGYPPLHQLTVDVLGYQSRRVPHGRQRARERKEITHEQRFHMVRGSVHILHDNHSTTTPLAVNSHIHVHDIILHTGLNKNHPLYRMHFVQCQASSAVLG